MAPWLVLAHLSVNDISVPRNTQKASPSMAGTARP